MIEEWEVNLTGLMIKHSSGALIVKCQDTYEENKGWVVKKGEISKELFREGVVCFEHEYSKSFLLLYLKVDNLSLEEMSTISNDYVNSADLGSSYISAELLESYINDRALMPIDIISTIRAALYFYRKSKGKSGHFRSGLNKTAEK